MVHGRWAIVDGRRGMRHAFSTCMKAKNLEDVIVHREAEEAADAVSALLNRPAFRKDFDLTDQLSRSASRIPPLIAEGFGQLTDKHVAVYLGRARGAAFETKSHLRKAAGKEFISQAEYRRLTDQYDVIGKRLTRWIGYLKRSNWKNRG